MIEPYKDRELNFRQYVEVYKNLNRDGVFSIRDAKSGLVVAHGDDFLVFDGKAVVSESGRQRVLESGRKEVHAFIRGYYAGESKDWLKDGQRDNWENMWDKVYYNPFKVSQFIHAETGRTIDEEDFMFKDGNAYILNLKGD